MNEWLSGKLRTAARIASDRAAIEERQRQMEAEKTKLAVEWATLDWLKLSEPR